jgi:hypothetical protein
MLSGSVFAQQAVIKHCKQTSSDADRIACLESALLGKTAEKPAPAAQIDPPSRESEGSPAEVPVDPTKATTSSATTQAVAAPAAQAAPQGIGAEQVIARSLKTEEERDAALEKSQGMAIAKYEWIPYKRLVVTFENGQVWRQIKGDTNRIRTSLERNQTADITESGLGGYKLRLNEIRRTIRVERIR